MDLGHDWWLNLPMPAGYFGANSKIILLNNIISNAGIRNVTVGENPPVIDCRGGHDMSCCRPLLARASIDKRYARQEKCFFRVIREYINEFVLEGKLNAANQPLSQEYRRYRKPGACRRCVALKGKENICRTLKNRSYRR